MDKKQLKSLFDYYHNAVQNKDFAAIEKCTNILKARLADVDRDDEELVYLLKKLKKVHIDAELVVKTEMKELKAKMEGMNSNLERDKAYTTTQLNR